MLKNYFKLAIRGLKKNKAYSIINISGLSVGLACCVMILMYVQYELSYDAYHTDSDRIYRVSREWFNSDGVTSLHLGHVAPPAGPKLVEAYPEIESMVRFTDVGGAVKYKNRIYSESRLFAVDPDAFKMFDWKLISGDKNDVLIEPNTVLLSKSTAEKYFDNEDPIGKVMTLTVQGFDLNMQVNGIFEDIPYNSHAHFDLMLSMSTLVPFYNQMRPNYMETNWGSNNWATYVKLPNGYDVEKLESEMLEFMRKSMNRPNVNTTLHYWKLTDIHLHSHLDSEIETNSNINNIYIFSAVALFILIIACFNFMNLSTARSANRAKEVGLRKVVGAHRKQLITQFLSESLLTAFVSMLISIAIIVLAMPAFNSFVNLPLEFNIFENLTLLSALLFLVVLVGLAAGSYPAFVLSSFKPTTVLKNEKSSASGGSLFRTTLVVTQFSISIILLIGMLVVGSQLDFMKNKKLGFDKERLVNFRITAPMAEQYETIKARLTENPGVISATVSSRIPSGRLLDSQGGRIASADTLAQINFRIADIRIDHDYFSTFGMEFAAGRDFVKGRDTQKTNGFIINEMTSEKLGFSDPVEVVGKAMNYGGRDGFIIGVVKDFHFESLHQEIVPIIFYMTSRYRTMTVRIGNQNIDQTLDFMRGIYNSYEPELDFTYTFVDERFDSLYTSEAKLEQIFEFFSLIAIIIACLGLFGLASYTAQRRTKEIGIRKVLGGSVYSMTSLLTKEFAILIGLANLLAWPIAYYFLNFWLENFAYRTEISAMLFVVSALAAFLIAMLTVSYQAIKTANSNPVNSLRYE